MSAIAVFVCAVALFAYFFGRRTLRFTYVWTCYVLRLVYVTIRDTPAFIAEHLPSGNKHPAGRMLMPGNKEYVSGRRHRMNLEDKSKPSLFGPNRRDHAVTSA